jgi:hypothetical protein
MILILNKSCASCKIVTMIMILILSKLVDNDSQLQ